MRTMNDVVKDRFGSLLMSICEMEVIIMERNAKITEIEDELDKLNKNKGKKEAL